ncbi:hypothetical protein [Sphingobium cloacae]|uniref:Nuclear transport factor 2 family protein n=1 Tax=Sphingobium cloacae TaxID=120107 RepID=A0A1E1F651_9SPHN|nr:hypothetical protein [Sphingobium cloacae]BAV65998.1 hypothetical protein SCLO_1029580 [Sphingobium cloacae]
MSVRFLSSGAALLLALSPMPAHAAACSSLPAEAGAQVDGFFAKLKADRAEAALDGILQTSPLWNNRAGAKEQLLAQMQAALKVYGAVTGVECVSEDSQGTMIVRQYWLAQHKDMVTRWEFDFMRAANGWQIGYFGFSDQLPTWF